MANLTMNARIVRIDLTGSGMNRNGWGYYESIDQSGEVVFLCIFPFYEREKNGFVFLSLPTVVLGPCPG